MSGKDEQPKFPVCPECDSRSLKNTFWVLAQTSTHVVDGMDSDDIDSITDGIYLDKNANKQPCTVNKEKNIETRVMISCVPHAVNFKNIPTEKVLASLLITSNVVKCSEDHIYGPDSTEFKKVFYAVNRYSHSEGVKYE